MMTNTMVLKKEEKWRRRANTNIWFLSIQKKWVLKFNHYDEKVAICVDRYLFGASK